MIAADTNESKSKNIVVRMYVCVGRKQDLLKFRIILAEPPVSQQDSA